jgi:hypothetical protein
MKLRPQLFALALAAYGCDDAPVQGSPDRPDLGAIDAAVRTLDATVDDSYLDAGDDSVDADTRDAAALPYARDVVSFHEGTSAGFGRSRLPDVVLGPPRGKGTSAGSLDVLSLGVGGEIVLDFGERIIVDGPGPDFVVFENAFWAGGSAAGVFAELGEVSVSDDLTTWQTFPCAQQPVTPGMFPGCAGWTPTLAYDPFAVIPLDPLRTGGDAFDLATLAVSSARYVRVHDLSKTGSGDNAGFDLDAIGIIHVGQR